MADTDFLVTMELYISSTAAAALRKNRSNFKAEKRPSKSDESKRLREKSSWLSIGKNQDATGHWRTATCKLSEDGDRSLLNIYIDESILFQTAYVHLLNQTDIRLADPSLFFRKHCLAIFSAGGQRWTSNQTAEPIYLHFQNADLSNAWLALLRSYAVPEIYGTWTFPEDGGAYRMWRRVELSVSQARNLASPSKVDTHRKFPSDTTAYQNGNGETEALDVEISCDIRLNDIACGKTTTKKGVGFIEWHENFSFSDLPPFDNLDIVVWKEKRLLKPSLLGQSKISLKNFRRGDLVDGYFPILQEGNVAGDLQVGELRLKIRVDEEIILPYKAYAPLLKTYEARNLLSWISDCETKLNLKTISSQLLSISISKNNLVQQVQEQAEREVDGTPQSHQTLFRGNTAFTKVMEMSMSHYGRSFLEASIGSTIRRLCDEKVVIEVDPARNPKGMKDVERMIELLIYWCGEFWNQIYRARNECPAEMRSLFGIIRRGVEQSYTRQGDPDPMRNRELPWQSVSAFCFLRFIVPGLLHPHLFGLVPGLPPVGTQRTLTLVAKAIQSLANLNASIQKEEFMRGLKDWLSDNVPAMIDYISVVSSNPNEAYRTLQDSAPDRHDRIHVVNSLRQRSIGMTPLARESIPSLPHLLDTPRCLSIITSAVIRQASQVQSRPQTSTQDEGDIAIKELCSQCFRVEEEALRRVSQLASHINGGEQSSQPPVSPRRRQRRRPSTAPSSSDSEASRRKGFIIDNEAPAVLGSMSSSTSQARSIPPRSQTGSMSFPATPPATQAPSSFSPSPALSSSVPQTPPRRPFHLKSPSSDSISPFTRLNGDSPDDSSRRKGKGLLRGILRR